MQPEFRCNKVVTLEVIYPGTQLKFWYFVLLGFYSLALNLSIMSHLTLLLVRLSFPQNVHFGESRP